MCSSPKHWLRNTSSVSHQRRLWSFTYWCNFEGGQFLYTDCIYLSQYPIVLLRTNHLPHLAKFLSSRFLKTPNYKDHDLGVTTIPRLVIFRFPCHYFATIHLCHCGVIYDDVQVGRQGRISLVPSLILNQERHLPSEILNFMQSLVEIWIRTGVEPGYRLLLLQLGLHLPTMAWFCVHSLRHLALLIHILKMFCLFIKMT